MSKSSSNSNKNKKLSSEVKRGASKVGRKKGDIKKTAVVKKTTEMVQWEFSHTIAFWGLAILLFLPPYFRGLFFQPEQERALIFAAVIFWFAWLWKWSKRDNSFLSHPLDYFVLAFPVVYLISAFQAANYGLAVDEVVKTTLCFLVYWLASRLVRNEKDIVTILQVIYISAIGVALAGLSTATGVIHINDGFLNERIYSTFQYPNALASYLAAVAFMGLYLWRRAGSLEPFNNINPYLYAIGNFLLFTVFLGTKSQGGLLVFTIVLILYVIGLPKGNRIPVAIHFILTGCFSGLAAWRFLSAAVNNHPGSAWLWVIVGLILALAGQALYSLGERKALPQWIAAHKNAVIGAVLLVFIAGCAGAAIYANTHSEAFRALLEAIRLRNATERFYFYHDALKMFVQRPILGWGGGGWQEAYRAFQSYLYDSNQVHGYYLQIMVEAGILGLLAIAGIWACFLYAAHRLYHGAKENKANRFLVWTITVAAISIGLHAVIDFDLSLSALALVLWTMFGLARGVGIYSLDTAREEKISRKYIPPNYSVLTAVSVIPVIVILFAGSLAAAGNYATQAGKYIQGQNLNQGIALLQKASAYNPFNADYHTTLARVYQATGKFDEGITEAQKAIELSKYSALRYTDIAGLYFNGKKNSGDAINYAEKALSLAPFQIQWYEFLTRTYFITGVNELVIGNKDATRQYFHELLGVPAMIEERMAGLNEKEKKLWNVAPHMTSTPVILLNAGAAQYFLGEWQLAESNLGKAAEDSSTKGEALLWLSILKSKQGKELESKELSQQALTLVPQYKEQYQNLEQLPLVK